MEYNKYDRKNMTWADAKWYCLKYGLEVSHNVKGVNIFDIADALQTAREEGYEKAWMFPLM